MSHASLGVLAFVTHARNVSSEARERFGDEAAALTDDPRVIVLRTCHRVELYVSNEASDVHPIRLPELPAGGRRLEDREAVRHLLAVAAGLDSIVVGEDQILHQLRDCLSERHLAGLETAPDPVHCGRGDRPSLPDATPGELQPILDRLFQLALHVGRQSRAWRESPPRSLADVALDHVAPTRDGLRGRDLLVVGAGQMSRLAALAAARRGARVIVTNRSAERAAALAGDVAGSTIPFGEIGPEAVAGVVVALAGRWQTDSATEALLLARNVPVVDLSSPPALSPALRTALDQRYVSVDDLARGPEDALRDRVRRRIERLLDEAEAEFGRWVGGRMSVPAIQALTEQAERRRAAEVDRLLRRMPHLAEGDRDLVEQMSRRLVAGLLHAPLATLRDDESGEHERAARDLFAL
ncbi:MAG TPA: hypothetical protein VF802_02235 [Candidatus Limnocylindrales bacterium]